MKYYINSFVLSIGLSIILCATVLAEDSVRASISPISQSNKRHSEFVVPAGLRKRVDFWIDIFTKYGKYNLVIHHRRFPQIVFKVLDLSRAGLELNEAQFGYFKKEIEQKKVAEIQTIIKKLSLGEEPSNDLEQHIADVMADVYGAGLEKYKVTLDEDLVRTQTGIKERYEDAIKRAGRYMNQMEDIFQKESLPVELTRLPYIESSFDYSAYSSVGAAGIWQFMRSTGSKYLLINSMVDERLDPLAASFAATKYLSHAREVLPSWPLAVTSYNHGITGVKRKVAEAGTENISDMIERKGGEPVFGFASSNFYPELLAAIEVHDSYKEYFPDLVPDRSIQYRDQVLTRAMSVKEAADIFNTDAELLKRVNYALNPKVWQGGIIPAGYKLKIPVKGLVDMASPTIDIPVFKEAKQKKTVTKYKHASKAKDSKKVGKGKKVELIPIKKSAAKVVQKTNTKKKKALKKIIKKK